MSVAPNEWRAGAEPAILSTRGSAEDPLVHDVAVD
jgi:hypothetical protein